MTVQDEQLSLRSRSPPVLVYNARLRGHGARLWEALTKNIRWTSRLPHTVSMMKNLRT